MAISSGNKILTTDINSIINSIQTTYNRYGLSGTASTVSNDMIASIASINAAINKLNASIGDSSDRRNYYYKGGKLTTITQGTLLSAGAISTINTTNSNVYKDYCNCNSDCYCDSDCCHWDCTCDSDGCGCNADTTDNCKDCCDNDCCYRDCSCNSD